MENKNIEEKKENENVIENNEKLEFNENKTKLIFDYSAILVCLKPVEEKTKFKTTYSFAVKVDGMREFSVKIDKSLFDYVVLCNSLGVKPFISKQIVREFSEEKNREYTCVKVVTIKGNIFRSFVDKATVESLDLVYGVYQSKNKK